MADTLRNSPSIVRSLREFARPSRDDVFLRVAMFVVATIMAHFYTGWIGAWALGALCISAELAEWRVSKIALSDETLTEDRAVRLERWQVRIAFYSSTCNCAYVVMVAVAETGAIHLLPMMLLLCAALYNTMFNCALVRVLYLRTAFYVATFIGVALAEVIAASPDVPLAVWMQLGTVGFCAIFMIWNVREGRAAYVESARQAEEIERRQEVQDDFLGVASDWFWETDRNNELIWSSCKSSAGFGSRDEDRRRGFEHAASGLFGSVGERSRRIQQALRSGKGFRDVSERLVGSDGTVRTLLFSGVPKAGEDGAFAGYRGVVRDVSDLMEAEQRRQKLEDLLEQGHRMRAIGHLSNGIAHEFNDVLTIMMSNLDLALDTGLTGEQKRLVGAARHAASRGSALTSALTALGGQARSGAEPVNVMQVIDSASALIRRTFSMKIELDVEAGEGGDWAAEAAIEVDPRMLECALINLAINARDTMPSGGRLTIGLSHQPSDGPNAAGTVHITVQDTGEGLAPEIVQSAINPKLAGEEELQSQTLGLAAVAGFLAQADGKMSIDSAPGQGTTVRMSFPEARARPAALSAPEPATGRFAGHRVLVVEDEPNVRRALTLQLKALGFEAQSVGHADAALGICRSGNPPDLVVSDIDMPGQVNGLELSSIFADEFPDLPVLLISGHVDGRAASDASGRGFLPKPFSSAQLTEAVARLMEKDADAPTQSNVVRLFDERA